MAPGSGSSAACQDRHPPPSTAPAGVRESLEEPDDELARAAARLSAEPPAPAAFPSGASSPMRHRRRRRGRAGGNQVRPRGRRRLPHGDPCLNYGSETMDMDPSCPRPCRVQRLRAPARCASPPRSPPTTKACRVQHLRPRRRDAGDAAIRNVQAKLLQFAKAGWRWPRCGTSPTSPGLRLHGHRRLDGERGLFERYLGMRCGVRHVRFVRMDGDL